MQLHIEQPFDLASSLMSGQAHRWRPYEQWYSGVIYGNLVHIRQDLFGVEFQCTPATEEELEPLLRSYFRLDDDLEAIYGEINADPRVAEMVALYPGLRVLRQEPWECLVAFICSATSNIPRIAANMESMADSFGAPFTLDEETRRTFPAPHQLAWGGETVLRQLGLGFRARYVAQATEQVAGGELDLEPLRRAPYEEAKARLMQLAGVGSKIADCVLAFSLEKMNAFPIDVWVRRALLEWYFPEGTKMRDKDLLQWAQTYFGRYGAYSQQYLFHGRRLRDRPSGRKVVDS